jgi:5-methylcytosine-specific restriction endonuclease McrA
VSKRCTKCGVMMGYEFFYTSRKEKDGHVSRCKKCVSDNQKIKRLENPEAIRERERRSSIKNAEKIKVRHHSESNKLREKERHLRRYAFESEKICIKVREYRKNNPEKCKASWLAWYMDNKALVIQLSKKWKEANPEKVKLSNLKYRLDNPEKHKAQKQNRRARERNAGGILVPEQIKILVKNQNNKCACCRNELNKYHVDHIVPLALDGSNDILNIQILCPTCNLSKGAKDPIQFMQSRGYLL